MFRGFKALDKVLRGEATRVGALRDGELGLPLFPLLTVMVVLGMAAGACTGIYAVITRYQQNPAAPIEGWQQLLSSTIKVPLLFLLSLVVTYPSLYVFNALVGSRLRSLSMLKLLLASMAVMMAVIASLGPIVAFFAVSTTSYPFMKLLNVVAYGIAGVLGLSFLLQTLHRLSAAPFEPAEEIPPTPAEAAPEPPHDSADFAPPARPPGALQYARVTSPDPRVRTIFNIWVVVFGLVGAQMSWILRPFIGDPDQPFTFFRARESHFFSAIGEAIKRLFGS
ncbi:MAG: hypothetical protein ACAI43_15680 [Phycisphaerae bacterium]